MSMGRRVNQELAPTADLHRHLREEIAKNWKMFWENLPTTNKLRSIKPTAIQNEKQRYQ